MIKKLTAYAVIIIGITFYVPALGQENKTWIVPADSAEIFAQRIVLFPLIDSQNRQLKQLIEINKVQYIEQLDSTSKALKKQIPSKTKIAKTFRATKKHIGHNRTGIFNILTI